MTALSRAASARRRIGDAAAPVPPGRHVAAVALLGAGGLGYEVALTRLLSALLVSDWVAPVLAAALLGLGLGAAAAAAFERARTLGAAVRAAGAGALLATLSLPLWLWAAGAQRPLLGLVLPVAAYAALGLALAAIYAHWPARAALLYRADLAAGAAAALLLPLALGALGGLGGAAAAALLLAGAAACLAVPARAVATGAPSATAQSPASVANGPWIAALALAVPSLGLGAVLSGALRLDPELHMPGKAIASFLARGGVIEEARWDATARTDLLRLPGGARYLFMEGGAGSLVPDPDPSRWWHDVGAFAFAAERAERAFLIGPGGGLDVAQARAHDVREVVAAEVNAASIELVRALGAAASDVYGPATEVLVGDGRRELARHGGAFDVITLANVVTGASELRGAALTENLVYTVEAFEEYLRHLTPAGRIALTLYDEPTLTRALTTALEALVRSGLAGDHAQALGHLMAVLDTGADPPMPLLLVRRSPFDERSALAAARVAEARGWALLLVPGLLAPPALERLGDGTWSLDDLVSASEEVDLRPTSDERPYFFAFEPGLPRDVRRAGLFAVVIAVALLAAAPAVARASARAGGPPAAARRWLASAALGAAFLAVELHALQMIQRAAGHPAWSLSLTLGAVLLGGALGASLVARLPSAGPRLPAAAAAAAVLAWSLVAPRAAAAQGHLPPMLAGALLAGLLLLTAVPMGAAFPRLLAHWRVPVGVAAAWAASGVAAVAAGAGALWLSHASGASAVAFSAVLAYGVAAAIHPADSTASAASGGANR